MDKMKRRYFLKRIAASVFTYLPFVGFVHAKKTIDNDLILVDPPDGWDYMSMSMGMSISTEKYRHKGDKGGLFLTTKRFEVLKCWQEKEGDKMRLFMRVSAHVAPSKLLFGRNFAKEGMKVGLWERDSALNCIYCDVLHGVCWEFDEPVYNEVKITMILKVKRCFGVYLLKDRFGNRPVLHGGSITEKEREEFYAKYGSELYKEI